jgi:HEAT repeat protein
MAEPVSLSPAETARLVEFARACKAAARAVTLYPEAHPAIATTLGRIVDLTSKDQLTHPLRIQVLPDDLRLDDRRTPKPDPVVAELAILLHQHLIGEMTVNAGGDLAAWRSFLLLLARSAESVRSEGGISRLWAGIGGTHVELREIDFAHVLRERSEGTGARWEEIVSKCLEGGEFEVSGDAVRDLLADVGDDSKLTALLQEIESRAAAAPAGVGAGAVTRLLQVIVEAVGREAPERLQATAGRLAKAIAQLTPETLSAVLAARASGPADHLRQGFGGQEGGLHSHSNTVDAVAGQMSDESIAGFVARNAMGTDSSLDRVAQAFQTLVRDSSHAERLLALAHDEAQQGPFGSSPQFEETWNEIAEKVLTSYSDRPFVSEAYARELTAVRTQAIEVEQVQDDPPERIGAWLGSVATTELRKLDLALVLDLLRIEEDDVRWSSLMRPVASLLEDLLLVGDNEAAEELVRALGQEVASPGSRGPSDRRRAARQALESLSNRLTSSPEPAVRRAGIRLIREFGGTDALTELASLIRDGEAQVQREAVRAIVNIGTEDAHRILEDALVNGNEATRDTIMQAAGGRAEASGRLFAYLIRRVDHRGPLASIYQRAIEALGSARDPAGVTALKEALYRGEWWAPRRSAVLRTAAAAALARIGTTEAVSVLENAASSGPRGVRAAARSSLKSLPARERAS